MKLKIILEKIGKILDSAVFLKEKLKTGGQNAIKKNCTT